MTTLSRKKRKIAETLAGGETTQDVARRFRVSAARISQLRRGLMETWDAFQGVVPDAA